MNEEILGMRQKLREGWNVYDTILQEQLNVIQSSLTTYNNHKHVRLPFEERIRLDDLENKLKFDLAYRKNIALLIEAEWKLFDELWEKVNGGKVEGVS